MTKDDILLKLKQHLDEEQGDARAYYNMAKAAKELGDKKLCRMLVCLAHDEVCHRHKIKSYLEEHEIPLTIDNEEEEQAEFLMFQLKKL